MGKYRWIGAAVVLATASAGLAGFGATDADAGHVAPHATASATSAALTEPIGARAAAALGAPSASPSSGVTLDPHWPGSEPCYSLSWGDSTTDSSAADLSSTRADYNCGTEKFRFTGRFARATTASNFEEISWLFNTDFATTGCDGIDKRAAYFKLDGVWRRVLVTLPSCDQDTWGFSDLGVGSPLVDSRTAIADLGTARLGLGKTFTFFTIVFGANATSVSDSVPDLRSGRSWVFAYRTPFDRGSVTFDEMPSFPVVSDTNGDGLDDIVFVGNDANPDSIRQRRGTPARFLNGPAIDIPGTYDSGYGGDFNRDGFGDVFLWNRGVTADALLLGAADGSLTEATGVPDVGGSADAMLAAGDFNGDTAADLLLYEPGAAADTAYKGAASPFAETFAVSIARTFDLIVVGDFGGDDRDDILLYGRGADSDRIKLGASGFAFPDGPAADIDGDYAWIVADDFNADDSSDLLARRRVVRSGSPVHAIYNYDREVFYAARGIDPPPRARALTGRFDRRGGQDVVWFRAGTGDDGIWYGRVI